MIANRAKASTKTGYQTKTNKEIAIVITFSQGSFQSGFEVSLQILNAGVPEHHAEIPHLPPAPELVALYETWRSRYVTLGGRAIAPVANQPTHSRSAVQDCRAAAKALEQAMTQWFQHNSFKFLRNEIRGQRSILEDDSVPVIFNFRVSESDQLRRLPWHVWDLFQADFLNAEVVLQSQISPRGLPAQGPLRVLAIYGSETGGISTADDRAAWRTLQSRADIDITELNQPTKSLIRRSLVQQPWDILFFAGHSNSAESRHGTLQIGQHPDGSPRLMAIAQLKEDLRRCVQNGLKLAIFNSCDGLGIADLLTELKVPFTIVMREPVADLVARRFIQVFLQQFSTGKRFYRAVRAARRELDWLENDFHNPLPSATWLPIVLQNPSQPELQWPSKPTRKLPSPWLAGAVLMTVLGATLGAIALSKGRIPTLSLRPESSATNAIAPAYSSLTDGSISLGEDLLTPNSALRQCDLQTKADAAEAMNSGQYQKAKVEFEQFLSTCPQDAEAEIYKTNAAVLASVLPAGARLEQLSEAERQALAQATVMLAVPVPLQGNEPFIAQEIMRGTAAVQEKFNRENSPSSAQRKILLQVVNDDSIGDQNLSDAAVTVAAVLAKDPAVLAVVGHYNSDATEAAGRVYNEAGVVAISPTSTAIRTQRTDRGSSEDAFTLGEYIFRASPSDQLNAKAIVEDMQQAGVERVLVAYDSEDKYSKSFKAATEAVFESSNITIETEAVCDFSVAGVFDGQDCLNQAPNADAMVFIPSAEVQEKAGNLLRAANSALPIWAGDAAYSKDNFQSWGDSFNGAKVVIPWHPLSELNDGSVFGRNDGKSWRTAMAYDATMALVTAIQQMAPQASGTLEKGIREREAIKETMAAPSFVAGGILGEGSIRFKGGDRDQSTELGVIVEVTAKDGQYIVQPAETSPRF